MPAHSGVVHPSLILSATLRYVESDEAEGEDDEDDVENEGEEETSGKQYASSPMLFLTSTHITRASQLRKPRSERRSPLRAPKTTKTMKKTTRRPPTKTKTKTRKLPTATRTRKTRTKRPRERTTRMPTRRPRRADRLLLQSQIKAASCPRRPSSLRSTLLNSAMSRLSCCLALGR